MRILYFHAPWCTACFAFDPLVPADVEKIDCAEQEDVAVKYMIAGLPCFVLVDDNGIEIDRIQTTSVPIFEKWRKDHGC